VQKGSSRQSRGGSYGIVHSEVAQCLQLPFAPFQNRLQDPQSFVRQRDAVRGC
jgi:hypothetical protein